MILGLAITALAFVVILISWIYKRFFEIYFWQNDSGEIIAGTGFRTFSPTLIAFKDERFKKFGMYLLRFLPGPPKLIITDPQIAVKFMAKQHKYERLKDFRLGSVFRQLFGHAAGTASGDAHKRIRSAFDPCYSTESVAQAVDMMEQECKQYLIQMVQNKQGFIRMADLIQLTFKILMKFTYGRDMTADELQELLDLRALVESLIADTFSNPFVKFPLFKYMPTSTNSKLAQFEKRWLQFNKRYVGSKGRVRSLLLLFTKKCETQPDNALLKENFFEFQETLEEASLANVDITCGAVAWLLFHVALHKDVQKNLTVEVKHSISRGLSEPLSLETLTKLDFLGKVVTESARKRPVTVISTPEYVTCPMVIGNFQSPPGVEVSVDNSAVNSNSEVWGDTETFNPRRFDDETPNMRKSLCRFGIGTRRCMGYRVADTFMKVLLVTLLENYSVALETDVRGDDDSVPVQNVGPFCFPCVDFKVQVAQKNVTS
ncbi:unnamed protein product [Porites lobata]|uniref:Cytochrome P450 n=1 Tax=Porites lobata TaxID=104759 RepID=A0ABN8QI12_9CNID|nr:unnamed protein product [Porites lobata]